MRIKKCLEISLNSQQQTLKKCKVISRENGCLDIRLPAPHVLIAPAVFVRIVFVLVVIVLVE